MWAALLCIVLLMSFLLWPARASAVDDGVLERSGIRYPDGYDVNTVGEVQGKVYDFVQPEHGPAHFSLVSRRDTYTVFVSPVWYWSDFGVVLKSGEDVRVIGSKSLGKDGNLYIIAQEIRLSSSGRSLTLRSDEGLPLWKFSGSGAPAGRGSFGSPQGGKGGGGLGGGGAGRGRR